MKSGLLAAACWLGAAPGLLCAAAEAQAQADLTKFLGEERLDGSSQGFGPPSGRYRLHIPGGMEQTSDERDSDLIILEGESRGVSAKILIKRVDVTPGASSSQLMLTTRDKHLAQLPNFRTLKSYKVKIAGRQCAVLLGEYDFQGNKGYPQTVEQAYVIDGSDGFIIHLEVPSASYGDFSDRLLEIFRSFRPMSPAATAKPK